MPEQRAIPKAWEHFPHEADIGVRGIGSTPAEAFEMAALALTAAVTEPEKVRLEQPVDVHAEAPVAEGTQEFLLIEWLNAVIFEMDIRSMLFGRFEVRIEGNRLQARLWGELVDPPRHEPAVYVKGATFTELKVERRSGDGAWIAQCVVDV